MIKWSRSYTYHLRSAQQMAAPVMILCAVLCLGTQLCSMLCDPWAVAHQAPLFMGILQARILEWDAMPSCRGSFQSRDQTRSPELWANSLLTEAPGKPNGKYSTAHTHTYIYVLLLCLVTKLCPTLCDAMDCSPPGSSVHGILQARIFFPTQGLNLHFLHCRWIHYNWDTGNAHMYICILLKSYEVKYEYNL